MFHLRTNCEFLFFPSPIGCQRHSCRYAATLGSAYFGFQGFLMYNPVGKCDVYDNRLAVKKRRRRRRNESRVRAKARECGSATGMGGRGNKFSYNLMLSTLSVLTPATRARGGNFSLSSSTVSTFCELFLLLSCRSLVRFGSLSLPSGALCHYTQYC